MPGTEWFPGVDAQLRRARARPPGPAGATTTSRPSRSWRTGPSGRSPTPSCATSSPAPARAWPRPVSGGATGSSRWYPNSVETLVAFLATASLGAVWSSCSPDFGAAGGARPLRPDRADRARRRRRLPLQRQAVRRAGDRRRPCRRRCRRCGPRCWCRTSTPRRRSTARCRGRRSPPPPRRWSSRPSRSTTRCGCSTPRGRPGCPRASCSRTAGSSSSTSRRSRCSYDLGPGDRFLWFTTTGWMMWNFLIGGLLVGATVVLYDGSPGHPDLDALWARRRAPPGGPVRHVGALPAGVPEGGPDARASPRPVRRCRRSGSTGSPLSPEQFAWIADGGRRARADLLDVRRHGRLHGVPRQRTHGAGVAGGAVLRGAGRGRPRGRREGRATSRSATIRSTWASW